MRRCGAKAQAVVPAVMGEVWRVCWRACWSGLLMAALASADDAGIAASSQNLRLRGGVVVGGCSDVGRGCPFGSSTSALFCPCERIRVCKLLALTAGTKCELGVCLVYVCVGEFELCEYARTHMQRCLWVRMVCGVWCVVEVCQCASEA